MRLKSSSMNLLTSGNIKDSKLVSQVISSPEIFGKYLGYTKLVDLHREWIQYIWRAKEHRALQAHRGSYKTTSVIVVGSLHNMTFNWNDRTAVVRKDFTSASDIIKVISRLINSPKYQALFYQMFGIYPRLTIDTKQKVQWDLKDRESPEGNLNAFGIGGPITGKHFDHILLDDIVTLKDRLSKAERTYVDNFVREILANVIDPGKFVKVTGTPWHKLDTWRILPKPLMYDIYSTGLKAFTPERVAEIKKQTTASLFAANYELKHIASEDTIFSEPNFISDWDSTLPVFGHIDAKYQGSHTGAMTMMARKPNGRIQAVGFIFYKHINQEYSNLVSKWKRYRCGTTYLELNADKGYAADGLSGEGMVTSTYYESDNKHVKIITFLKKYWSFIDWYEETDQEYLAQILDYVEGQEPDDCADSAASCIRQSGVYLSGKSSSEFEEYEDEYKE